MTTQTTKTSEAVELLKALNVKVDALQAAVAALAKPAPRVASGEPVFPNYGKAKGMPVRGADRDTLDYYANGARRSLADSSKERFHAKEQALLAAIEAELARQSNGDGPPPHTDNDAPGEMPF